MTQPEIGPQRIRSSGVIGSDGIGVIPFDLTGYLTGRRGVITRMIAGLSIGRAATLAQDSFTRTVASGWGSPSIGPDYLVFGNNASSVNGSQGILNNNSSSNTRFEVLPLDVGSCDITFLIASVAASPSDWVSAIILFKDTGNFYRFTYSIAAGDPRTLTIAKQVGGSGTVLATTTKNGAPPVKLRFRKAGTLLQGKMWVASALEPTTWDLEFDDNPPGLDGIGAVGAAAVTFTATIAANIDDLLVVGTVENPIWDAYIGEPSDPSNLVDSSQGVALPRWVPSLVNGLPVSSGDVLTIVASDGAAGSELVASLYLTSAPVSV